MPVVRVAKKMKCGICQAELGTYCDEIWIDYAGNLIGLIRADNPSSDTSDGPVLVMAHLDEIAMAIKKINEDGSLQVTALGGINPVNFGMCPVDIMGDKAVRPGVLSYGSMHMTGQSQQGKDVQSGNVQWQDVHVVTRLSTEELVESGIRPGTRVVMSQHWRKPFNLPDAVAAHFLDDRAPVAAVLAAVARLRTPAISSPTTCILLLPRWKRKPTQALFSLQNICPAPWPSQLRWGRLRWNMAPS